MSGLLVFLLDHGDRDLPLCQDRVVCSFGKGLLVYSHIRVFVDSSYVSDRVGESHTRVVEVGCYVMVTGMWLSQVAWVVQLGQGVGGYQTVKLVARMQFGD